MRVILTRGARLELRDATKWYAERSEVAARRFDAAFHDAVSRATSHPERWPEVEPGIRRVLFARYPFSLLYALRGKNLVVIAVMHQRRRPGYWHGR